MDTERDRDYSHARSTARLGPLARRGDVASACRGVVRELPVHGAAPADPANKRKAIRIVLDPDDRPVAKGKLCAQDCGFNLHAATVAANDQQGRLTLCRYILRPPLANDRLKILDDGNVKLEFKKPCSDGTASVEISPLALIARLAALVVPSGPRACPPCPCPTRLRRARRPLPSGISSDISGSSRHTQPHAVPSCLLPQHPSSPNRTSRPVRRSTFRGQIFSEEHSGSRSSARSATASFALSRSSRPKLSLRRFSRRCTCQRTSRNFIPPVRRVHHPRTRVAAMTG